MLLKISPFDDCITTLLEKAFTFIWTIHFLKTALNIKVVFHHASFNDLATTVAALKFCLFTIYPDMIVHLVLYKLDATVEKAIYKPIGTGFCHMMLEIFTNYETTLFCIIWTFDWCPFAFWYMAIHITTTHDCIAIIVGTCDWQFKNKSSYWNIGFQLAELSHAKRTISCLLDTFFTEKIVAAFCLHSILKDVKTDGTEPSIVW